MAKEETKTEVIGKNEAAGITHAYFKEQAAKTAENRSKGGEDVKISLTNKTNVRFTKDFGKHLKEGDEMEISDMALAIYEKAGVLLLLSYTPSI